MPIRPSNLTPPFNVVRASHVEFGVRDLEKSRAFYVDCLGYLVTAQDKQSLYLRAVEERNHHSIVLTRADSPCAHAIGFKLASEEDLDRAAFYFARKGLPTSFPEVPYQGRTLRTVDAVGMPIDFYARMDEADCMIRKYAEYRGARIQRIDHINCFTPDVQASYDFYTDIGFRLTEYTETDDADDPRLWAVWLLRWGDVHGVGVG
jgi:catechol 2,3-dioxygenase